MRMSRVWQVAMLGLLVAEPWRLLGCAQPGPPLSRQLPGCPACSKVMSYAHAGKPWSALAQTRFCAGHVAGMSSHEACAAMQSSMASPLAVPDSCYVLAGG